ncbi:MAG: DUF2207 family protein [Anaerolineae bacterium]
MALVTLLVLGTGLLAQAQSKSLFWRRFDVDITVLENGDLRVREVQEIVFTSGSFTQGFRYWPMDRLDAITDLAVSEPGHVYTPGQGTYQFRTYREGGDFYIEWYFPPVQDASRTYTLEYTVKGAFRVYEGGDQVYWKAVYADRDFSVQSSTVTVHLPAAFSPEEVKFESYGASAVGELVDGQTVVFRSAGEVRPGQELEVRVQFPHGVVQAVKPEWQEAFDREREYDERWRPVVNLGLGALGVLLLVAGPLAVVLLWYTRGRDVPVEMVAEYIPEPPSALPPGVVGALVDESADMEDIVATLVDLARRGVIRMEEVKEPGFLGIGERRDYEFYRLGSEEGLRPYEVHLLERLFGPRDRRRLSDLKEKFYTAIPEIKKLLYKELVEEGLFPRSPESTRAIYLGLGIAGLVVAVGAFILLSALLSAYADATFCPSAGLAVTAVVTLIAARFMPRKTAKGSEEAAKWKAFRRYLDGIEKYTNLKESTDIFDAYLPYAIAFGLEKGWVRKFAEVGAPAPTWWGPYYPTYGPTGLPRPAGGSPEALGRPGGLGAPAHTSEGGGLPSLEGASEGMFRSLESMSNGLFSMLESASRTLTSAPAPKGGGGGGGWSGGGGGGGGGSGGGGGGFR